MVVVEDDIDQRVHIITISGKQSERLEIAGRISIEPDQCFSAP
jgi:hypothetical protein